MTRNLSRLALLLVVLCGAAGCADGVFKMTDPEPREDCLRVIGSGFARGPTMDLLVVRAERHTGVSKYFLPPTRSPGDGEIVIVARLPKKRGAVVTCGSGSDCVIMWGGSPENVTFPITEGMIVIDEHRGIARIQTKWDGPSMPPHEIDVKLVWKEDWPYVASVMKEARPSLEERANQILIGTAFE